MLSVDIKELLEVQQNAYKDSTMMLFSSLNERIDQQNRLINDLRLSLEFSQQELREVKDDLKACKLKLTEANDQINQMIICRIAKLEDQIARIEDYSRRKNFRIEGLTEGVSENWEQTLEKVKKVVNEKLEINDVEIEYAHRLPRQATSSHNAPRTILARLAHDYDRDKVMKKSWKLKGSRIYLNEDLSEASSKVRQQKIPELKAAVAAGKVAFFIGSKLIIKDRKPATSPTSASLTPPQPSSNTLTPSTAEEASGEDAVAASSSKQRKSQRIAKTN